MRIGQALEILDEHPQERDVETFRTHLREEWIESALAAHGVATLRRRRLPMEQLVWFVLGMSLYRSRPMWEVVDSLDLALPDSFRPFVDKSSIIKARQRLGDGPMHWLFERSASSFVERTDDAYRWRGLSLYGVDGTTFRVPDSEVNRKAFGLGQGKQGASGYPLVRMVALMSLRTHLLLRAEFGPYSKGEYTYARRLWDAIPSDSLTLVDRNYFSAELLLELSQTGRHWLIRKRSDSTEGRLVTKLGRGDRIVEKDVSQNAHKRDPSLPRTWTMRVIDYTRADGSVASLYTSLLDAKAYPADEVVELYHERWDIELGFDEIKTHMIEQTKRPLRSQSPQGVRQELWGLLLAYNLVRFQMVHVAKACDVSPNRISFCAVAHHIVNEWMWNPSPGAVPRRIQDLQHRIERFVLPPRRKSRRFERAVKIKMSNYKRKRRPPPSSPPRN